ncbi:MAG: VWA domain-containing protein [Bacteroidetes bacterium]|nr:VWA domain-containing protein [Bacteroidota bacterium]
MALDEFLFGKVVGYFKQRKKAVAEQLAYRVTLDEYRARFTLIARATTGVAIDIFPAEREGGYKNESFFLPSSFSIFESKEDNYQFYLFRILYLSVQRQLNLNWTIENEQDLTISRQRAEETAPQILKLLFHLYPYTERTYQKIINQLYSQHQNEIDLTWLYGKWMINETIKITTTADNPLIDRIRIPTKSPDTILKAKAVEEIQRLQVDKKQQEDYVLTHNFEKVETAEEFNGSWRDMDGDDDLAKHENALDELNMRYTVRVDDPAHSVYHSEFIENLSLAEVEDHSTTNNSICYDEWDYSKRKYKTGFCKVFPTFSHDVENGFAASVIAQNTPILNTLRKALTNIHNKSMQHRRQLQGSEFDIDATTDLMTDVLSGHTPSEKIYLDNRKTDRHLSILLLLDTSLSTDGYVAGNRIINIEREVAVLFGQILFEFDVDFSIATFYSKTRNHTRFCTIKGFDEPWNYVKNKVGSIEPEGYTRIGAALRHAGAQIMNRTADNKWIILLSDGKPNDYDRYEGRYGMLDVKQALRELNEHRINTYALAIENSARYYLPQMFGPNHYDILSNTTDLFKATISLFSKLKR